MGAWTKEQYDAARAMVAQHPDMLAAPDGWVALLAGAPAEIERLRGEQATDADVEEALRLDAEATPGPWERYLSSAAAECVVQPGFGGAVVAGFVERLSDVRFIARARTLLPALARRCQMAESLVLAHEEQHAAQVAIEAEVRAAAQDYEARWKAAEASESRLTQQVEILAARSALTEARLAETIQEATDCTNEIVDLKRRLIDLLNDAAGAALAACEPGGAK